MKVGFIGPTSGISIQQLIKARVVLSQLSPNQFIFVKYSGKSNSEIAAIAGQVLKKKTPSKICEYNQLVGFSDIVISMPNKESPQKLNKCWDIVERANKLGKKTIIILPNGKDYV